MPNESSIELSYDDVRQVILQYGFQFEVREQLPFSAKLQIQCPYHLVTMKGIDY